MTLEVRTETRPVRLRVRSPVSQAGQVGFDSHTGRWQTALANQNVAKLGIALGWGPRDRRFESDRSDLRNHNSGGGADGSTPVLGTGGSGFDPQAPDSR